MAGLGWWLLAVAIGAACATALRWYWRPGQQVRREKIFTTAQREFRLQREQLEAKFCRLAGESGKPRGLRWTDCDFQNEVTYARDRSSGALSAFVGVTISFEAVEGGNMEDVEAVSNKRAGTAVFHFDGTRWITQGRAIFNLNPTEAIQYYQSNLEKLHN